VKGKSRAKKPNSSRNRNIPLSLKIWVHMQVGDQVFTIRALIDTGAEVNIIKKGTIPPHYMQRDNHPLTLKGADDSQLTGGNLCLKATGVFEGKDID